MPALKLDARSQPHLVALYADQSNLQRELELLRKLEASADEIKALKTRLEYTVSHAAYVGSRGDSHVPL